MEEDGRRTGGGGGWRRRRAWTGGPERGGLWVLVPCLACFPGSLCVDPFAALSSPPWLQNTCLFSSFSCLLSFFYSSSAGLCSVDICLTFLFCCLLSAGCPSLLPAPCMLLCCCCLFFYSIHLHCTAPLCYIMPSLPTNMQKEKGLFSPARTCKSGRFFLYYCHVHFQPLPCPLCLTFLFCLCFVVVGGDVLLFRITCMPAACL